MKRDFQDQFPLLYESGHLLFDQPLAQRSSFKIGGRADVLALPNTQKELIALLTYALQKQIPYFILGKGTNLLISDKGIRGLVIGMEGFQKITRDENYLSAFAGVKLRQLCEFAQQEGLAGLEFAHGIPGSVGGAVFMNAGAYGGEIKDRLYCSKCLIPELEHLTGSNPILHLTAEQHDFSYRMSALQKRGLIHLSSVFRLFEDEPSAIKARMKEIEQKRWEKQPMDLPSGGSVFKRPQGHFTGKLVEDCGLKGHRIGGAAISDKHCGFIVNLGQASAQDVLELIKFIQKTVYERYQVTLETEIRLIGER
ncbi:MAG: UDP-N-acetylmuramate dehydrogenase [Candidatus Cloacimonetes bacterium]|nr:UDP-N-acetylmuramate dehydrogenase [Candidatus Cloacimonadota bacterium]MDY0230498.1 UDP-N-acetylmuramate dehydrogenase [Candidatus Cloacimonadaceae bacterium]